MAGPAGRHYFKSVFHLWLNKLVSVDWSFLRAGSKF